MGGTHSPAGEGMGKSRFGRLEKKLSTVFHFPAMVYAFHLNYELLRISRIFSLPSNYGHTNIVSTYRSPNYFPPFMLNNIFPFPVCMERKLGNFFTNREHALKGDISSNTASTLMRQKTLRDQAIWAETKKIRSNKNVEFLTHRIRSVSPDDAGGYRSVNIFTRGCSFRIENTHLINFAWLGDKGRYSSRQYIDGMISACVIRRCGPNSVRQ